MIPLSSPISKSRSIVGFTPLGSQPSSHGSGAVVSCAGFSPDLHDHAHAPAATARSRASR